jgi:four helix bundle protein
MLRLGHKNLDVWKLSLDSLVEMDTLLEISNRLGFCSADELSSAIRKMNHIFAMLSNPIKSERK